MARADYAKFIASKRSGTNLPPTKREKSYAKHPDRMPGPNAPDPKFKKPPGVLGDGSNGAYFIPGLGEWGRKRNAQRNRKANETPFNPGRNYNNSRYS